MLAKLGLLAGELLVVCVGSDDVALSGVTFAGDPLSAAVTRANPGKCRGAIYYLPISADTTGDIVASWSGTAASPLLAAVGVQSLAGNQLDQTATNTGSGASADFCPPSRNSCHFSHLIG
jgi:hypothetical protein